MKRITVILENTAQNVADLTEVLGSRGINIETFDVEGSGQTGVVNLTVDRYDESLLALRDAGFRAISEDAIVVRLKDEPGALARVAVRFKNAGIAIRSMHIITRSEDHALATIVSDRQADARELVRDVLVSGV